MKINSVYTCFAFFLFASCSNEDRVKAAYSEKMEALTRELQAKNIQTPYSVLLQAFKHEKELEVWIGNDGKYQLFKTYSICRLSGDLGRKQKEGDKQVPEGFYRIERFNPKSNFHLSLKVSYPNEADLLFADKEQPGSDIFIHGACVSVGRLSMTHDKIKEIYLMALEADKTGNEIPVNIYPFRMTEANFTHFSEKYPEWRTFWESLKVGYDRFYKTQTWEKPSIQNGQYYFNSHL